MGAQGVAREDGGGSTCQSVDVILVTTCHNGANITAAKYTSRLARLVLVVLFSLCSMHKLNL